MHTQFSDDLMNETLTPKRKISSCKLLGPCKRENIMARLDTSNGYLSAEVMFLFPWLFTKIGRKEKGNRETRESSSFICRMRKADFMVIWW